MESFVGKIAQNSAEISPGIASIFCGAQDFSHKQNLAWGSVRLFVRSLDRMPSRG